MQEEASLVEEGDKIINATKQFLLILDKEEKEEVICSWEGISTSESSYFFQTNHLPNISHKGLPQSLYQPNNRHSSLHPLPTLPPYSSASVLPDA